MNSAEFFHLQVWFNYKRKRFWTLVLIFLYTLLGFFAVPAVIKSRLPEIINGKLNRDASMQKVEFNPWTLHLRVYDFVLIDTDGSTPCPVRWAQSQSTIMQYIQTGPDPERSDSGQAGNFYRSLSICRKQYWQTAGWDGCSKSRSAWDRARESE